MSNETTLVYVLTIKDDYISKFKRILNGERWDIIEDIPSYPDAYNYIPNGESNLFNQFESGPKTWDIYANRLLFHLQHDINYRKCEGNLFTSRCYIQGDISGILKFCELVTHICDRYYISWWNNNGIRGKFTNSTPKIY